MEWDKAKLAIEKRVAAHSYRMWIEPLGLKSWQNGSVVLLAPNFFSRRRVIEQYSGLITAVLCEMVGGACHVSIEVSAAAVTDRPPPPRQCKLMEGMMLFHNGRPLRREFTFDRFVVGGNNDFAYSAAISMASGGQSAPDTLLFVARPGMGKSHLSHAIGHHIVDHAPTKKVFYATVDDFTGELVQAFQADQVARFKEKYRNGCDVLLLEDLHHLTGKERTQVELAHILDGLREGGKKIIFSSCCLPNEISRINDRLCSRLFGGLISNIEPPDEDVRAKIIRTKAAAWEAQIPDSVVEYLAAAVTGDVRRLEGVLTTVMAMAAGGPVTSETAEAAVKACVRVKNATVGTIIKLVSREYGVGIAEMVSATRRQRVVCARSVAMYLVRRYTGDPLQAIGKCFNRSHATVLHAINNVEKGLRVKGLMRKQVEIIMGKIG
jgi:chromosomal replication initiator protein